MPRSLRTSLVAALSVLALAACTSAADTGSEGPTIIVTTSVWSDVVSNVACDGSVEIQTLIPRGADPHAFEPSLADRVRMDEAALIVLNGLGLEVGLQDTINASALTGTPTFRIAEHLPTLAFGTHTPSGDADHEAEHEHADDLLAHTGDDPHVWFDPVRVSQVLPQLAEQLSAAAGVDPAPFADCATAYQLELAALDAEIVALVDQIPEQNRKLITSHDSLGYFADRYGFEIVGTIIPGSSGLGESNPAQLQFLADTVQDLGLPAVFAESQESTRDAEALADSVGVDIVVLETGTLGEVGSASGDYLGLMRTNAELISRALAA